IRAALEHPEYTHAYVAEVMREAKPMLERFLGEKGVDYWPSGADYLWIFPRDAEAVNRTLMQHNILVRPKADINHRPGLRITVGTLEQTERLISVLQSVL